MGIYIGATVHDFDPQEFGEWLGRQDSQTQSSVIVGLALTLDSLGHMGDRQVAYLADDLHKHPHDNEVEHFIESLHGFWKGE
jgi:hypothetical protein